MYCFMIYYYLPLNFRYELFQTVHFNLFMVLWVVSHHCSTSYCLPPCIKQINLVNPTSEPITVQPCMLIFFVSWIYLQYSAV